MLSVCVQDVVAATLVDEGTSLLDAADGQAPGSVDVWLDAPPPTAQPGHFAVDLGEEEAAVEARLDDRSADAAAAAAAPHHLGSPTAAAAAPAAQAQFGSAAGVPPQPPTPPLQSAPLPSSAARPPQQPPTAGVFGAVPAAEDVCAGRGA